MSIQIERPQVNPSSETTSCSSKFCFAPVVIEVIVGNLLFRLCSDCQEHLAKQLVDRKQTK